MKIAGFVAVIFGIFALSIVVFACSNTTLCTAYFCSGLVFGTGIYFISLQARKLTRVNEKRLKSELSKLIIAFLIILLVYTVPMYLFHSHGDFTLLLTYASGGSTGLGVALLRLRWFER